MTGPFPGSCRQRWQVAIRLRCRLLDCIDQPVVSVAAQECKASKSTPNSSPLLFGLNLLLIEVGSQLARIHKPLALVGPQPISRHWQCLLGRCAGRPQLSFRPAPGSVCLPSAGRPGSAALAGSRTLRVSLLPDLECRPSASWQ